MSLAQAQDGRTVHFPKKDKFEFDAEVSAIFPDMARRSIPLFYETHELHARLCEPWMAQEQVNILDVGASRGAFLNALHKLYDLGAPGVTVFAIDSSTDMCEYLARDFRNLGLHVQEMDIAGDLFMGFRNQSWDIINCTYVVQFVAPDKQVAVLQKLARLLKPGGVLFLGQKMQTFGPAGRMLHEQYIQFRTSQGYTREEIEAKTAALSKSMWPFPDNVLVDYLNKFGLETMETSRFTVFNNYMCTKGL